MDGIDIESVLWYLNEYKGTILPYHRQLSGLGADELVDMLDRLDDKKRLMLIATAKNIHAAVNGTATKDDVDEAVTAAGKPSIRRMHRLCPCLSRLLTSKEDIPEDAYGKAVADTVHDMLEEIHGTNGGKGCSSCKRGRIVSKYRVKLYSLLKEGKHC